MYYKCACEQITVFDFNQGFGFHIDKDNRWVKLSEQIPWSEAEELYAANFNSTTGNKAIPFRTTLGALIIRRAFHLSDRATVKSIQENPYLQYFLGVQKYTPDPLFDPSMMTHFRERIDLDAMGSIADMIAAFEKKRQPQDSRALNPAARSRMGRHLTRMPPTRTHCRKARKEYLNLGNYSVSNVI